MIDLSDGMYALYNRGFQKLIDLVKENRDCYQQVLVFQQRLEENIYQVKHYGDTDGRRSQRSEIIANLNRLSLETTNVSFNELCDFPVTSTSLYTARSEVAGGRDIVSLAPGAWTRVQPLSQTYDKHVEAISLLLDIDEYEQAKHLYWKILYFTGYRERWDERALLSKHLLKLSIKNNDYKSTGLILSKGIAYALITQKRYAQAQLVLAQALKNFRQANAYQEEGVFFDYMADIYEETGQLQKALSCYDLAMERYTDIDKYRVYLKRLFLMTKYDDLKSRSRIVALTLLRDQFSAIKNYREALVDIELAITFYALKDAQEARYRAQQAFNFFNNTIMMPRNAAKAVEVLQIVK